MGGLGNMSNRVWVETRNIHFLVQVETVGHVGLGLTRKYFVCAIFARPVSIYGLDLDPIHQ